MSTGPGVGGVMSWILFILNIQILLYIQIPIIKSFSSQFALDAEKCPIIFLRSGYPDHKFVLFVHFINFMNLTLYGFPRR